MPVPAITNRLLAILPADERSALLSHCEEINLDFGETLTEPGETYHHVYFPLHGFISLISLMNGKSALETGLVGSEGMLGATLALGIDTAPARSIVQGGGTALRIEARVFSESLEKYPSLRRAVMHYLYVMIQQLAQTSACTRFHVVEARLARWLMMTQDRAHSDTFDITQQFLSCMLGVRREGVTGAASRMQQRGLIHYRRGHLSILDRPGLENTACSCYVADNEAYDNIMGV